MRSSGVRDRLESRIWRHTIFVVPVPDSATIATANSNRFVFCSGSPPSRRRSDTSGANRSCKMRLMIASKFWSRSTYLKPYPRLIGHLIGDSALYHSLHWMVHSDALGCHLPNLTACNGRDYKAIRPVRSSGSKWACSFESQLPRIN
jgi:hypothetical protein